MRMKASQKAWLLHPSKTTQYQPSKEIQKTSYIVVKNDTKLDKYGLGYTFYNPKVIFMYCHAIFNPEYHEDTQWHTFEDVAHPLLGYRAGYFKYGEIAHSKLASLYPLYLWSTVQRRTRRMHNSLESLRIYLDGINSDVAEDVQIDVLVQRDIATIVRHLDVYQTSKITLNKPVPSNIPSPIVSDKDIRITRVKSHLIFHTRTFQHKTVNRDPYYTAGTRHNPEIMFMPYNEALGQWFKLGMLSPITDGQNYMLPSTSELSQGVGIGVLMNYDVYMIKVDTMYYDVEVVSRLNPMQSKLFYHRFEELKRLERMLPIKPDNLRNKYFYVDNRHHSQVPIIY